MSTNISKQKRQFFICHFSAWSMLKNVFNIFLPI